jgi:alkanesulfonate monooxygenase SsuD/methylene tetrahydromethanopterin reductase-like flavin-dependent oxidoreductase (luciferase family)
MACLYTARIDDEEEGIMQYAVELGPYAAHADPRALGRLARTAEDAGWDGFFIWDAMYHDAYDLPKPDPWIALAAVAMSTERIRLGPMVTPLPRRRPWKVARETVSLDQLSGGRLILGVGIGDPPDREFGWFGEETDPKVRAQMLDEALEIIVGLWSGQPFSYAGQHYHLHEVTFQPTPVQQPRIPIWVGGWWPNKPPMRRAARWDGVHQGQLSGAFTPREVRDLRAYIATHRTASGPFDVAIAGSTPGDDPVQGAALVASFAEAGVTWWIEGIGPDSTDVPSAGDVWPIAAMERRIAQGPPRVQEHVG